MAEKKKKKGTIFDKASKVLGKGSKARRRPVAKPGASSEPASKGGADTTSLSSLIDDPELVSRLELMVERLGGIRDAIDKAYEVLGMSRDDARSYIENPNNFSPEQWKALERERDQLSQELFADRARRMRVKEKRLVAKKKAKKRKGKMLGRRKKGWIPL